MFSRSQASSRGVGFCQSVEIFLLSFLIGSCAATRISPARLYNLRTGGVINASLFNLNRGYGKVVATMPDGEMLNGEFTMTGAESVLPLPLPARRPPAPSEQRRSPDSTKHDEQDITNPETTIPLSEDYGFGKGSHARPVGTATLIGKSGIVLDIIFYNVNFRYEYGDGIARDNKGNHFRVHLGELPE